MQKIWFTTIYLHHLLLREPIMVASELDEASLHAYLTSWVNRHLFPLMVLQDIEPPVITSPSPPSTTPHLLPQQTMVNAQEPLTITVQYFTQGPITTFKIPTNWSITNQDLYDFLINDWYARVHIFCATLGMRFQYNITAFLFHPFLSSAIPVKPRMTNRGFQQELI